MRRLSVNFMNSSEKYVVLGGGIVSFFLRDVGDFWRAGDGGAS